MVFLACTFYLPHLSLPFFALLLCFTPPFERTSYEAVIRRQGNSGQGVVEVRDGMKARNPEKTDTNSLEASSFK